MENKNETLLTRREAAGYLKVTVATIHNWTKLGLITPHKIQNRVYFYKEEIDNDIKTNKI